MANVIPFPLSDRPVSSEQDVRPFLNNEAIPLLRQIRTTLNESALRLDVETSSPAIAAPVDLPTALVAINQIRQVLIDFGLTE